MWVAALLAASTLASTTLAVVDVSATNAKHAPLAALADELRDASGHDVVSARRTQAVVDDAASFGIDCRMDDDPCLVKLRHFLKVDALLAFALGAGRLELALLDDDDATRVKRVTLAADGDAPKALAKAAWQKLSAREALAVVVKAPTRERIDDEPAATPAEDAADEDGDDDDSDDSDDTAAAVRSARTDVEVDVDVADPDAQPLPASAMLGIVGGLGAVACGIGAVAINMELVRQQREADAGRLNLAESGYRSLEQGLVGLSFAAGTAAIVGAVGGAWFLTELATTPSSE